MQRDFRTIFKQRRCAVLMALGGRVPVDVLNSVCVAHLGLQLLQLQSTAGRRQVEGVKPINPQQQEVINWLMGVVTRLLMDTLSEVDAARLVRDIGIQPVGYVSMTYRPSSKASNAVAMFTGAMLGIIPGIATISRKMSGDTASMRTMAMKYVDYSNGVTTDRIGTFRRDTCSIPAGRSSLICVCGTLPEDMYEDKVFPDMLKDQRCDILIADVADMIIAQSFTNRPIV